MHSIRRTLHPISSSISKNGKTESFSKKSYDGLHIEPSIVGLWNGAVENNSKDIRHNFDRLSNYAMTSFEHDTKAEKELSLLISYLQQNRLTVSLILSPYHPDLYAIFETKKQIFLDIEKWFRQFAKKRGIEVFGSYDPGNIGCNGEEFYDGMHPKSTCISKIFKNRIKGVAE